MFHALPDVLELDGLLAAVAPDGLARPAEVLLVVGEHDQVLERRHRAARREVDVRRLAAERGRGVGGVY